MVAMDEASSSDSGGARESFSSSEGSADEAAWSADVDEAHRALGLEALVWRGIPRARRRREWVRLSGALDLARSDGCVDEGGDGGRGEPRLLPPPLLRRDVDAATAERRLVSAVSPAARADVECDVPRSGERRPRRAPLRRVLLAYAARSQRVGYCQGLDVVAASILREVGGDEAYAFWLLAALVERRCEGWWDANLVRLRRDVGRVTAARHAKVAALVERDVPLDLILVQWLLSLFGHVGNDYTARSVRARTLDVAL
ncbi:rab-GTPase-TBC domain-containing protein [Pelagophyceae sp. CCMP2097]|nr:rab-GTPase-TBC domain-containing protein [Pelagophyceae sp. CCMP2097]